MLIDELDGLPPAEAADLLRSCADVDSWVTALTEARPYGDRAVLLAAARAQAGTWTPAEVDAALADHPRIGERHTGTGASAEASRREQSDVAAAPDQDAVQRRLDAGNRAYEERFDRIFLVRARGRDADEILALLEQRLTHTDDQEAQVVAGQLAEIALLRLEDLVQPGADRGADA